VFLLHRDDVVVAVNFGDVAATAWVDGELTILLGTPTAPVLADGMLDLPPHAGALLGPHRP
jgi:hypothetical protein